ncbi:hypothetical protein [Actinomadura rifamycini]|uniref:hypothetical protein n=1 Tax=Actinomadura rifamycini TaxID=31962 RepID=UPI00040A7434|nr:hypothetical protein [Actinomadura rifamycini]
MTTRAPKRAAFEAAAFLLLAAAAAANWAAWLGWDQRRDVHPDGSETGPYQPWQVAGLVLVLVALTVAAAVFRHPVTAAAAPVLGTMAALCADWSDDATGLWAVGALMASAGLFTGAVVTTAVVRAVRDRRAGAAPA